MSTGSFKYYEDFIKKKEGRNKWTEYWAVIHGTWILFYTQPATLDRDNFRGSLELTPGTKCSVGKRRAYSFPFYISSARGAHLFKCQNNLKRHQWMYVIALAIRGDPPAPPPSYISTNETEVTTGEVDRFQSEMPDKESEEDAEQLSDDNDSLPPGVVFVMNLPDEMADGQGEINKIKESLSPSFMPAITLTTSISGCTNVTGKRSITDEGIALDNHNRSKQLLAGSGARKFSSRSAELLTANSKPSGGRNMVESTLPSLLTATGGSLFLGSRPNTSPGPQEREGYKGSWPLSHNTGNLLFSRHMVHSSPNVKMLAADDFT